jgi:hypothetical protein
MPENSSPADVLASPAVGLLCRLEAEGFTLWIDDGDLVVRPISRLEASFRAELRAHKADLLMLVRICDDGVQDRRQAIERAIAGGVPRESAVVRPDVTYVAGVCFSCGVAHDAPRFGKCWRCALAWRLALRLPIDPGLALVYDNQRRVA